MHVHFDFIFFCVFALSWNISEEIGDGVFYRDTMVLIIHQSP